MDVLTPRSKRSRWRAENLAEVFDALADITTADESLEDLMPQAVVAATRAGQRGYGGGRFRQVVLPLDMILGRDLNTGTAGAGGNLVGSPRANHAGTLRGFSVVADAGATVVELPAGTNPPSVPNIAGGFTPGWKTDEYAPVPESDVVFGLRALAPKTLGFWFRQSRRLLLQGGRAASELLRREIGTAIGRAIDSAALQGSGSGGQPLGLSGIVGVHAQAGAALAWSGVQNMLEAVTNGGATDEAIQFIGTPAVRKLLAQRERAAGSGLVWADGRIDGKPAYASREAPTGTLFAGDFSRLIVALHGGVQVQLDAAPALDGSFRTVVLVDVDILTSHPAAFSRATSIT